MAQQRMPGLGIQEMAGIGFALGVLCGVAAMLFAGTAEILVPCAGAAGLVVMVALRRLRLPRLAGRPVAPQSVILGA